MIIGQNKRKIGFVSLKNLRTQYSMPLPSIDAFYIIYILEPIKHENDFYFLVKCVPDRTRAIS